MLILSRKTGEVIKVGDQIAIHVVEISKGFVKIGIEAPDNVKILRQEVFERIRSENIEAAKSGRGGLSAAADMFKKQK